MPEGERRPLVRSECVAHADRRTRRRAGRAVRRRAWQDGQGAGIELRATAGHGTGSATASRHVTPGEEPPSRCRRPAPGTPSFASWRNVRPGARTRCRQGWRPDLRPGRSHACRAALPVTLVGRRHPSRLSGGDSRGGPGGIRDSLRVASSPGSGGLKTRATSSTRPSAAATMPRCHLETHPWRRAAQATTRPLIRGCLSESGGRERRPCQPPGLCQLPGPTQTARTERTRATANRGDPCSPLSRGLRP